MILIKYTLNGESFNTFTNGCNDFVSTITALRNLGAIINCKGGDSIYVKRLLLHR